VVEVTTTAGRFLEVVARPAAGRLVERHTALAGAVPVPEVLAVTDDGVLVLPGLPGTPMRTLPAGDGAGLPDPAHLDALLDALSPAVADLTAGRRAPGDALARVDGHARVLAAADASPESADSPNESVTDSPDDVAPADASPESADSPAESAWDSADDTPDD
jgi:hypothetical protein